MAELATRNFWDAGYRHHYDWSDRTKGYSHKKDEGVFRILVLGDSNAYGQGVQVEETFAKIIEKKLNLNNLHGGTKRYEVVNIAFPGISTADEYVEFISKGMHYKPDMVLVAYFLNDLGGPHKSRLDIRHPTYVRRHLNRRGNKWSLPIPWEIDVWLNTNSDFYCFFVTRYNSLLGRMGIRKPGNNKSDLSKEYSEENKGWKITKDSLNKIYRLSKRNGMANLLTIIPYFHQLEKYGHASIHSKVAGFADSVGFNVLDLLPFFEGEDSKSLIVSRIDSHPNEKAHKIMAKKIHEYIIDNNLHSKK